MTAQQFYLSLPSTVQFIGYQPGLEQARQAEEAQRFIRNAARSSKSFRFLNPATIYRESELGEKLAAENPGILHLWLPMAEPPTKGGSQSAVIYPDELGKIIPVAGRDLGMLLLQNVSEQGWPEEMIINWAPVVVWSVFPVESKLWGYFVELWLKMLAASMPIMDAYTKALEGVSSDFPEAREAIRININQEFARERLRTEPPFSNVETEPEQTQESEQTEEPEQTQEQATVENPSFPPTSESTLPPSSISALTPVTGGAHSDHPTEREEKDWLGYKSYAQIIAQIIKDPGSEPPLSIAIIGPWGQGKSSLMRMIQRRVTTDSSRAPKKEQERAATPEDIQKWTTESGKKAKNSPPNETWEKLSYPSVWFNPWEYQSSEQLWAGMAHAIIHQLVGQLPTIQQEKFWLDLHLERVDKQAIRQRLYRDVLIRALPWMLMVLVVAIIGTVLIVSDKVAWALGAAGLVGIPSLIQSIYTWVKNWREGLENVYDEFLKPPDYGKNLGVYHEVNDDLERVFRLLVDQPAVIFIDDLDRCSPRKVVEVIEAINLIMNARFRQKCYFVIGMDAEMVAAALDVAYQGMAGKFPGKEKNLGSVGWYFLDKFIQVPVVLPTMSESDKAHFLEKLFDKKAPQPSSPSVPTEVVKANARELLSGIRQGDASRVEQVREQTRSEGQEEELDEAVLEMAYKASEDASEIHQQVKEFATYLDPSPRSIKRFANLLRFYTAQQQLRETKATSTTNLAFADTGALAKWLIITLRWPMMVRWLQWREDLGLFQPDPLGEPMLVLSSNIPEEKAKALDLLVLPGMGDVYYANLAAVNPHLPWLADHDLIRVLSEKSRPEETLLRAFECDVW